MGLWHFPPHKMTYSLFFLCYLLLTYFFVSTAFHAFMLMFIGNFYCVSFSLYILFIAVR